jgi:ketopantoate reductase
VDLDLLDEHKGHLANNQPHYNLHCVEEIRPTDGYELVIVPVNAHQLIDALCALIPCVRGDATFLLLTSNWEGTAEIDAVLPRERYLPGYADGGTVRNGAYWTNLGAEIHLGALEGQSAEKLAQVKALFKKAKSRSAVHSPGELSPTGRTWHQYRCPLPGSWHALSPCIPLGSCSPMFRANQAEFERHG